MLVIAWDEFLHTLVIDFHRQKAEITNVIEETDIVILQLFAKLKYSLGGSRFKSDDEVKEPLHTGCPNICFPQ